jgi:lysozyme family protein
MGITQKTLSGWLGRNATIDDVKRLDKETAKEIYIKNYLSGPRIDTLPDDIVPQVFDISINSGPRTAIKIVQKTVNLAGFGPIGSDGVMGPKTRNAAVAANEAMGKLFNNAIAYERINFYERIIENDPSQEKFRKGWMRRAKEFLK